MSVLNNLPEGLEQYLAKQFPYQEVGRVEQVIGLVIESKGPKAKIGDLCLIHGEDPGQPPLPAEVVGFKAGRIQLMPLGEMIALGPDAKVTNTGRTFHIPVSNNMLGRVIDGLGRPLDGLGALYSDTLCPVTSEAPPAMGRKMISEALPLGVRSLDGFMTVGKGQRMGIFAGSGVGKSTMMGMIARNTQADMNVIALIGERGREVREFIEHALGPEGVKRSIVVVSTAEQPALLKIKAALVATTIAEHFRNQGSNVLLMLDSLTRVAMALREVGLSIGEPPTSRGYTPSVFAFLPKLLERAGNDEHGSITGLYSVLVEGDDFNEPITDTVRGLLDGHIMLTRELAYQNHFPAIDVLKSISRVMPMITDAGHRAAAAKLRDLMAIYQRSEDIITIGAYAPGSNPKLDQAIALKDTIDGFLKQSVDDKIVFETMLEQLNQITARIK